MLKRRRHGSNIKKMYAESEQVCPKRRNISLRKTKLKIKFGWLDVGIDSGLTDNTLKLGT